LAIAQQQGKSNLEMRAIGCAGTYLYKIKAGNFAETGEMSLLQEIYYQPSTSCNSGYRVTVRET